MSVGSFINSVSKNGIYIAASQIKATELPQRRWLRLQNRYATDVLERINTDHTSGTLPNDNELAEYVAASVITHCYDGWRFLAQAVDSLLDGDLGTALHLAYYAELRATLSFLASEGIAIFNRHNYWFDSMGTSHLFAGNTHTITWKVLNEWADVPANSTRLLKLFRVNGITFDDWLVAAGYRTSSISLRCEIPVLWRQC